MVALIHTSLSFKLAITLYLNITAIISFLDAYFKRFDYAPTHHSSSYSITSPE